MRLALYGLTVLALLGGAYGYLTFGSKAFDPVATAKLDVKAIEKAAVAYCIKSGEFPPNLDALVSAGSLDSSATRDPWKNAYQYDPAGISKRRLPLSDSLMFERSVRCAAGSSILPMWSTNNVSATGDPIAAIRRTMNGSNCGSLALAASLSARAGSSTANGSAAYQTISGRL